MAGSITSSALSVFAAEYRSSTESRCAFLFRGPSRPPFAPFAPFAPPFVLPFAALPSAIPHPWNEPMSTGGTRTFGGSGVMSISISSTPVVQQFAGEVTIPAPLPGALPDATAASNPCDAAAHIGRGLECSADSSAAGAHHPEKDGDGAEPVTPICRSAIGAVQLTGPTDDEACTELIAAEAGAVVAGVSSR